MRPISPISSCFLAFLLVSCGGGSGGGGDGSTDGGEDAGPDGHDVSTDGDADTADDPSTDAPIDTDDVSTSYANGFLEVRLAKRKLEKTYKIPVSSDETP